jgi:hypothetical protein
MIRTSRVNIGDDIVVGGRYRDIAELLESRLEFLDGKEKVIMTMQLRHGATFRQIAALTGLHEASVARLVRKISSRLLKGAFIVCLRKRDCLTKQQLAIARDSYLSRLSIPAIAKKHKCTLYHVRLVLSHLAKFIAEQYSPDSKGRVKDKTVGRTARFQTCPQAPKFIFGVTS